MLRHAVCSLLFPRASGASAASLRLFSAERRGPTAGEAGDAAAKKMQGAEGKAAGAGERVEEKVSDGGFVAEADSVLSPETAGRAGGLGADVVGDMVDMVGAAVKGDSRRALRDGEDMARHGMSDAGTNAHTKPPHTTTQDWPRGSITDPPAASGESASAADGASELASAASSSPFVSTDEAHGAGSNRYEGTIPPADSSKELPDVDQDPPESVAAGPTLGYSARGGDNRPI